MGVIIIQIRRPLLIILMFVVAISFIITNNTKNDEELNDKIITIQGVVKGKIEKKRYNQYKVGVFLINDYTKNKNLKIGQKVNITGKFKSLDKMKYDDFDYGRYIKSTGYKGIVYINNYKIIDKNKLYSLIGEIKFYISKTYRYLYKKNSDFIKWFHQLVFSARTSCSMSSPQFYSRINQCVEKIHHKVQHHEHTGGRHEIGHDYGAV